MFTPEVRAEIMIIIAEGTTTLTIKAVEIDTTWLANEIIDNIEVIVSE